MKIILEYSIVLLIVILSGCNSQIKFDKQKWAEQDDMEYPYRNSMLNDLLTNYKLQGMKYNELTAILGQPWQSDSNSIFYDIVINYGTIDPIYMKTLELDFGKDSIVKSFKVNEWKK